VPDDHAALRFAGRGIRPRFRGLARQVDSFPGAGRGTEPGRCLDPHLAAAETLREPGDQQPRPVAHDGGRERQPVVGRAERRAGRRLLDPVVALLEPDRDVETGRIAMRSLSVR